MTGPCEVGEQRDCLRMFTIAWRIQRHRCRLSLTVGDSVGAESIMTIPIISVRQPPYRLFANKQRTAYSPTHSEQRTATQALADLGALSFCGPAELGSWNEQKS